MLAPSYLISALQQFDVNSQLRSLVGTYGSPLLVLDCAQIRAQYRRLAAALPRVDLHYAMKALPHAAVLSTLNEMGSCFDVCSLGEIAALSPLRVPPARLIHTHPIKRDCDISDALDYGCRTFVVDNAAELKKFVAYREKATLVLRIAFSSTDAAVDLSKKFGCAPDDAFHLLEMGKQMGLSVAGLSFHVGSQCSSPRAHVKAIADCCVLIEKARAADLTPIRLLDIGGGFPAPYGADTLSIEDFCKPISGALRMVPGNVRVIAEPGRFIAAPAMTGITTVLGKTRRGGAFWYYLDDGVFGSFNGRVYDRGARYPMRAIDHGSTELHPTVLAGPTCDSIDILDYETRFPELQIGDLIVADLMGAYTMVCASDFNSIPKAKVVVLNGPDGEVGMNLANP